MTCRVRSEISPSRGGLFTPSLTYCEPRWSGGSGTSTAPERRCSRAAMSTSSAPSLLAVKHQPTRHQRNQRNQRRKYKSCLLYTSDAADDLTRVDLGGRRIIKKKKKKKK